MSDDADRFARELLAFPLPSKARLVQVSQGIAVMQTFSAIASEHLRWLWPGRIPLGKLTLIAGDPGLGKSLVTTDIAARVSTGQAFPDGAACEQGSVIILSAEDDPGDTIRPRLDVSGADVSRVHLLEAVNTYAADGKTVQKSFSLETDHAALEEAIQRTGARLVIVDPISAYLGGTDSHSNAEVRGLLSPLTALAAKHSVAVLAITHLRKSAGAAIYRAMGSLAFAAAARSVWGITKDQENESRRLFIPVKQNLAAENGGLAYQIEAPDGVAKIAWGPGTITIDAETAMGGFDSREDRSERREAEEWLREFLTDGPRCGLGARGSRNATGYSPDGPRRYSGGKG